MAKALGISVLVIRDISLLLESRLDIDIDIDIDIEMRYRPSSSSKGVKHSHDVCLNQTAFRIFSFIPLYFSFLCLFILLID